MKKLILIAMLPITLALLSFVEDCPDSRVVRLENGNYIADQPILISTADEVRLNELADLDPDLVRAGFFFVSCYENTACKFKHGKILGSGCCTSGVAESELEPYQLEVVNNVRVEIDEIMSHYMR